MARMAKTIVRNGLLVCGVHDGMFSDERTVVVKSRDGKEHSFFVPKDAVEGQKLKVIVSRDEEGVRVTIPTPEAGTVVFVNADEVTLRG